MLNKIVLLLTLALNTVRKVNSFENYNEYLNSLKTTEQPDIHSLLNPWAGLKIDGDRFEHHVVDEPDTDDYDARPVGAGSKLRIYSDTPSVRSRRYLGDYSITPRKSVYENEASIKLVQKQRRVKRASKRNVGSILRARGKTTPGTDFSSEEVDHNNKEDQPREIEPREDEIKVYKNKGIKEKKIKNDETSEIHMRSEEKNDSDIVTGSSLSTSPEKNEKVSLIEPEKALEAIRERNEKIRREFEAREVKEKNQNANAQLDSVKSSSNSEKSIEKTQIRQKRQRKNTNHKLKTRKNIDKYSMTLNSNETDSKITNINILNPASKKRRNKRRNQRKSSENRVADNSSINLRVNYREKARENLEHYKINNPDDDKKNYNVQVIERNNSPAEDSDKVDKRVEERVTNSYSENSSTNLRVNYREKARENLEHYKNNNPDDDKNENSPVTERSDSTSLLNNKINLKPSLEGNDKVNERIEEKAASDDRNNVNPLVSEQNSKTSSRRNQMKDNLEVQEPEVASTSPLRRSGVDLLQVPNIAVLDNDYTMYVNDQDYNEGRRILQIADPKELNEEVSADTKASPNNTSSENKKKINNTITTQMILSTNLTSVTKNNKEKNDVSHNETDIIKHDPAFSSASKKDSEYLVNDYKTLTTEVPLLSTTSVTKQSDESPDNYTSVTNLNGPVINVLGSGNRHNKSKKRGKTDEVSHKTKTGSDATNTLIGPVVSSKFSQSAPIHNNFNIENVYVIGLEFVKLKGKPTKRASCHKPNKNNVEITINVESLHNGISDVIQPIGKSDFDDDHINIGGGGTGTDNKENNLNNNQKVPSNQPSSSNNGNVDSSSNGNKGSGNDPNKDEAKGDKRKNETGLTREGSWVKLINNLADSGFLDIAADYTPKPFDPNDYPKSDSDADPLQEDSSSGEYECIKKHKKNPKPLDEEKDGTRRRHKHSHHKHHRHGLRTNILDAKPKQKRFVKEYNMKHDALSNIVIEFGKFLQTFSMNKDKDVPTKEYSKPLNVTNRKETTKMKSYIKELKSAFKEHFHGLVQYDWLGTAVDTEASLLKLLGLTMHVAIKKKIHIKDLTLLNYVEYLFGKAVREFPDYIIENTLQNYMPSGVIEEADAISEKFTIEKPREEVSAVSDKPTTDRAHSEDLIEMPNSKFLFREFYIPEPYRRDDNNILSNYFGKMKQDELKSLDKETLIGMKFKEFLIEMQSNLSELHLLLAVTPNEPNPDDWVTLIKTLFISMNFNQNLKYAQILLHIQAAELFNNIENSLYNPYWKLEDVLTFNSGQVEKDVKDMMMILKILTYIRLI